MFLSPHFQREEFEPDGPMPEDCVETYRQLCLQILEPLRARFGPLRITSGWRPPLANAAAGGCPHSQHQATSVYCAADWYVTTPRIESREVFDWFRLESNLPVDQVILEHGKHLDILHTSFTMAVPRHDALEGATGGREAYTRWTFRVNLPRSPQAGTIGSVDVTVKPPGEKP